jgi:hypothetical protein
VHEYSDTFNSPPAAKLLNVAVTVVAEVLLRQYARSVEDVVE